MKTYKVMIQDENFKEVKFVNAPSLIEASKRAKQYFSVKYFTSPKNIKVGLLNPSEHINEIFEFLYNK